jgi:hypothetical protein
LLLRLAPLKYLRTPPILDQVLRIHPPHHFKRGAADQQVRRPRQDFVSRLCDDFEWAIFGVFVRPAPRADQAMIVLSGCDVETRCLPVPRQQFRDAALPDIRIFLGKLGAHLFLWSRLLFATTVMSRHQYYLATEPQLDARCGPGNTPFCTQRWVLAS